MPASTDLWATFRARSLDVVARPAVRTADGALTFGELFRTADDAAQAIRRAGVREDSYVVFAAPNSLGFFPALLALWRLSASVGLFSSRNGTSELLAIDEATHPSAYLVPSDLAGSWGSALGARSVAMEADIAGESFSLLFPRETSRTSSVDDAALIKFTSGSTGAPKGIALTSDNLLAEAESVSRTLDVTPIDTILAPVPMFHSYGFDLGGLAMLGSGATLVLSDAFVARRVVADLADGGYSIFLGVPSMYRILVDARLSAVPGLSGVRYLLSCTAPLPPSVISAFHDRFGAPICQHYGSSETGAVTTHVPSAVLARPESVGRAMVDVSMTIVDDSGQERPPGSAGEVVVRGPAVAHRYTMGAGVGGLGGDGSFRTGDIGVIDEDGFLSLAGRLGQMINVGGFKVSPVEVERVLELFPAVREAAVIGARDKHGEEVVYAAVTLRQTANEAQIIAFCRALLADYKVPRRIEIRRELPRGPSGKVRLDLADFQA